MGTVHKYGDNVDTDAIIPARHLTTGDGAALARHCMEDIDPAFAGRVAKGDIIVAGRNFGCGSSREHAPLAIKCAGVAAVVADSFARIFYRNAINIGLPIFECPEAVAAISNGDSVEADPATGAIADKTTGRTFLARPFPAFIREIISAGGLVEYARRQRGAKEERP